MERYSMITEKSGEDAVSVIIIWISRRMKRPTFGSTRPSWQRSPDASERWKSLIPEAFAIWMKKR